MRIDEDGLLSLQFLMPKPRSNSADPEGFVEFRVSVLGLLVLWAGKAD